MTLNYLSMMWTKLLIKSQLLIINNMDVFMEKNNQKNLYSLVVEMVVVALFLTKTAVRMIASTIARSKAARTVKSTRNDVHRCQYAQRYLTKIFKYAKISMNQTTFVFLSLFSD